LNVLAILDTEFTDLGIRPRLLSVGLVTSRAGQREFYAEVTDRDRIHATNWFGLASVLPQFGKVAGASCTYAVLGAGWQNSCMSWQPTCRKTMRTRVSNSHSSTTSTGSLWTSRSAAPD
jgi:hypothetical protein